jgi:hypothetical protein
MGDLAMVAGAGSREGKVVVKEWSSARMEGY